MPVVGRPARRREDEKGSAERLRENAHCFPPPEAQTHSKAASPAASEWRRRRDGRCCDHSRHVPAVRRRVPRRAGGGPRHQVHERRVPRLRQEARPHRLHKNTTVKVERSTQQHARAYPNRRKDDWDSHLTLAEVAINNTAWMLGDDLTPFFIDRGAQCRTPPSLAHAASPRPRRGRGQVAGALRAAHGKLRPRWDGAFTEPPCSSPTSSSRTWSGTALGCSNG